jgi:hypothetical protein
LAALHDKEKTKSNLSIRYVENLKRRSVSLKKTEDVVDFLIQRYHEKVKAGKFSENNFKFTIRHILSTENDIAQYFIINKELIHEVLRSFVFYAEKRE